MSETVRGGTRADIRWTLFGFGEGITTDSSSSSVLMLLGRWILCAGEVPGGLLGFHPTRLLVSFVTDTRLIRQRLIELQSNFVHPLSL